jgi:hypothetical protein
MTVLKRGGQIMKELALEEMKLISGGLHLESERREQHRLFLDLLRDDAYQAAEVAGGTIR